MPSCFTPHVGTMSNLILFNKPFRVLSQFTDTAGRPCLHDYFANAGLPGYYPAGRLDFDSEGLLLLTNDGRLQHRIAHPAQKLPKIYWAQVEGQATPGQLARLEQGVLLKDGMTLPARARAIPPPAVWPRTPPVRFRQSIPTSWLELAITEGRNRQVRRMTAAVGLPTLRLIRVQIGTWRVDDLQPGCYRLERAKTAPPPRPSSTARARPRQRTRRDCP